MQQKQVFYKSDFSAILSFDGGWSNPFRLKFWTNSPSRAFVASYDGTNYSNCHVQSDGRLCIAFDSHNMGLGVLMLEPTFYLNNQCYLDGVCMEVITPFAPVFKDAQNVEYNVVLALDGSSTMQTIGTLPAFYQKGDRGDSGVYIGNGNMPSDCNVQIDPSGDVFDPNTKVDKVTGKGLSTNDYTNADKGRVANSVVGIENEDGGIEYVLNKTIVDAGVYIGYAYENLSTTDSYIGFNDDKSTDIYSMGLIYIHSENGCVDINTMQMYFDENNTTNITFEDELKLNANLLTINNKKIVFNEDGSVTWESIDNE